MLIIALNIIPFLLGVSLQWQFINHLTFLHYEPLLTVDILQLRSTLWTVDHFPLWPHPPPNTN